MTPSFRIKDAAATHVGNDPHKDISLDTKTLEQDFLAACDWDPETATPSKRKLESLGIGDVAEAISAR